MRRYATIGTAIAALLMISPPTLAQTDPPIRTP